MAEPSGPPTQRLASLGLTLPVPTPLNAAFQPFVRHGDVVYVSGQIAIRDGALIASGRVGAEVDLPTAQDAARVCALNLLAALQAAAGSLDNLERLLKITVFIASTAEFTDQPAVADGASRLLNDVLGPAGAHARSAIGVAALPLNTPVEIEAIAMLRPGAGAGR
jgi:enamine deaminase RidA (YjgF/YER057c/UK114 family)